MVYSGHYTPIHMVDGQDRHELSFYWHSNRALVLIYHHTRSSKQQGMIALVIMTVLDTKNYCTSGGGKYSKPLYLDLCLSGVDDLCKLFIQYATTVLTHYAPVAPPLLAFLKML